jgi:LysM repeat protein
MTRKQAVFIIIVNAFISTCISVIVALSVVFSGIVDPDVSQTIVGPPTQAMSNGEQAVEVIASVAENAPPTVTPFVYIVQPGDSISSLAVKFDVPGADIIAANRIQNPDYLVAGVELTIPTGGLPPSVTTWPPTAADTETPLPFEPPSAQLTDTVTPGADGTQTASPTSLPEDAFRLEIVEILGAGLVEEERVVISNTGDQVVDMTGWSLTNPDGNTYVFPNYRLWPGGTVTVHTGIGQDGDPVSSLFWGRLSPVWVAGEVATLRNAEGVPLVTYVVSP